MISLQKEEALNVKSPGARFTIQDVCAQGISTVYHMLNEKSTKDLLPQIILRFPVRFLPAMALAPAPAGRRSARLQHLS